jgi:Ca-activated chloride channel family protein
MKPIVLLIAIVMAVSATAQQPTFRSGVDAVRVDVSVMNGVTPVRGLTAENFELTDQGVVQKLASVSLDSVPLSLMLVLDTSGSMQGGPLADLIDAARGLVQALRPDDAAGLTTFSEPVRLTVPLSTDRRDLAAGIDALQAAGATSLHDAVFLALQRRPADTGATRPVMLVFSDGLDTASWLTQAHVLEAARRSGTLIHVVELGATSSEMVSFARSLAEAGGGRQWSARSPRELRELFGKVLDELRSRYLLTYYPEGVAREGWHDVRVSLKRARGTVTARPGYFVSPR